MAKVLAITLALAIMAVAAGCGSSGGGGSTSRSTISSTAGGGGSGSGAGGGSSTGTEAKACVQTNSTDLNACHASYAACSRTAKATVQAFKSGKGPQLDIVAAKRAEGLYTSTSTVRAGTIGCLVAFLDEFNKHGNSGAPVN
jgi:hypothetical protein